jgi:hypothetical protein
LEGVPALFLPRRAVPIGTWQRARSKGLLPKNANRGEEKNRLRASNGTAGRKGGYDAGTEPCGAGKASGIDPLTVFLFEWGKAAFRSSKDGSERMKFAKSRPYANPDKAARRIVEIASTI